MRAFLGIMLLFLLPTLAGAAVIEGRVIAGDEPLPGVLVAAYASLDYSSEPVVVADASDDEGYYRMELPAGTYALYGWSPDRSRFAFCGRNPVNLSEATEWAGLQAVAVEPHATAGYDDEYSAAIEGHVFAAGVPLSGAYVYLYLDVAEDLKGQGYRMSLPTTEDGYFRFDGLPESNYFLVVRKRQNGQRVGPVQAGDMYGVSPSNPLTARAGKTLQLTLHTVEKVKGSGESETFGRATGPVLSGRVLDRSGEGVADVHVFAYVERVIGHQRPAAISAPTAEDGRFVVNLPAPGTYYIGAREAYGDSPAPGELFGMYEESADHGLTIEAGQVFDDLRIVVEPVAIF